eukprot:jgi/Chrzof1/9588/Cz04g08160.t1
MSREEESDDAEEHHVLLPLHIARTETPSKPQPASATKLGLLVCLVLLSASCAYLLNAETLSSLFERLKEDPLSSLVVFFLLFVGGIVILLPGMVLTIGTGAVYGFLLGACISWLATSIGQTLAFLLGRYLLRDTVSAVLVKRVPNFSSIDESIRQQGWKLVVLLRISPFIPYNILNYVLALTSIDLASFAVASSTAVAPYALFFAYLGSASTDLIQVLEGAKHGTVSVAWLVASAVILGISGVGMAWLSHKALRVHKQIVGSDHDEPLPLQQRQPSPAPPVGPPIQL